MMSEQEAAALWTELKQLREEFSEYKLQVKEAEGKRLRTALVAAGGIILALLGFLWFEIIWPLLHGIKPR
jgi:hypothetical protein